MRHLLQKVSFAVVFFMAFCCLTVSAQVPQTLSYQAVIRNGSNVLVASSPVGMQISILQGSASGAAVYVETQSASTNANGLVSVEVGNGSVVSGNFTTIDWANGPFFIMTETDIDNNSSYDVTSTLQLTSVPYALYAATSGSSIAGPQGPVGPQGPAGQDGINGQDGAQGPAGADGAVGPEGPQGPVGPQGPAGADGAQGPAGADGAVGPQGPAGADGAQGPAGADGAVGPQGPAGADGAQGPAGADGAQGPQGPAGADGAQGPAGADGAQGPAGADGANGLSAYEVWVNAGNVGTEADFLAALVGPQGPAGADGAQGPAGADGAVGPQGPQGVPGTGLQGLQGPQGNVNCLDCHNHQDGTGTNSSFLASVKKEFEHSKHGEGVELALEEGFSTGCSPCHSNEGFHSVVDNNVVPTYTTSTAAPYNATYPKYSFSYNATAAASSSLTTWPGNVGCFTCHSAAPADSMARLDFTAGIKSTMWSFPGQEKTFDIAKNNHESNLCMKCHQPRPMSRGTFSTSVIKLAQGNQTITFDPAVYNGKSIDYADLAANPSDIVYDSTSTPAAAATNIIFPSYRMHNHYGAVGAIFAGNGAVEFAGSAAYTDTSAHRKNASCVTCHMAKPTFNSTLGEAVGGHTFRASGNVNGCKTTGCHTAWTSYANATVTATQNAHKAALSALAQRLKSGGIEIMHKNTDPTSNIFAGVTAEGYDGYLDIYDPSTNPTGQIRNPIYPSTWTAAQKATNIALPALKSLTKAELGAIINFQLLLREFSIGVHNPKYATALFTNTNEALTAVGLP